VRYLELALAWLEKMPIESAARPCRLALDSTTSKGSAIGRIMLFWLFNCD